MPPHLSEDLKNWITDWYYVQNMTMEEIRDLAGCSIGTVYNTIHNVHDFGVAKNPFNQQAG